MAIHRRGYNRYQGKIEGRRARFLVLPRFSWKMMFRQRVVILLSVCAMINPLLFAFFVYIGNNADLVNAVRPLQGVLKIDNDFFMNFMSVQKVFAVFLAALTGPGLIAPDVANNALQLYFSRPLTRLDYALGRLTALMGLLSLITWIPCLAIFLMQASMAEDGWIAANWRLGLGTCVGFLFWILLVSFTALVSSAWVKLRVIASGLILGFFFILSGVASMINGVFRGTWGHLLNPSWIVERAVYALSGIDAPDDVPGAAAAILAFLVILFLLTLILERKLRPVEVIA